MESRQARRPLAHRPPAVRHQLMKTRTQDIAEQIFGETVRNPYRWLEERAQSRAVAGVDERARMPRHARRWLAKLPGPRALVGPVQGAVLLRRSQRAEPRRRSLFLHAQARRPEKTIVYWPRGRRRGEACCSIRTQWSSDGSRGSGAGRRARTASTSRTRSRRTTPSGRGDAHLRPRRGAGGAAVYFVERIALQGVVLLGVAVHRRVASVMLDADAVRQDRADLFDQSTLVGLGPGGRDARTAPHRCRPRPAARRAAPIRAASVPAPRVHAASPRGRVEVAEQGEARPQAAVERVDQLLQRHRRPRRGSASWLPAGGAGPRPCAGGAARSARARAPGTRPPIERGPIL